MIRYSTTSDFIDAPSVSMIAWASPTELVLEHTIKGLGDGTWFVSVGFAFAGNDNNMYNIILGGSADGDGWSDYGTIEISGSYNIPELILPTEQPYQGEDLVLRWTPGGPNITELELQYSTRIDFTIKESLVLLPTDNGYRRLDLVPIGSGIIYFRLRGATTSNTLTEWTYSTLDFEIVKEYFYILPWTVSHENGRTFLQINILNSAATTDVQVGVLPEKTGTFTPTVWFQTVTAYQASIFLIDAGDLFPFSIQGRPLLFKSTEPISISVYFDMTLGDSDVPVQTPFLLDEGSSQEWIVPSVRQDAEHLPSIVLANVDPEAFAVFDWRVDFIQDGVYDFKTGGLSVGPFDNAVIDLDVQGDWVGYVTIYSHTDAPVSAFYSNRNEIGDLIIYGFQPALQK